MTSVNSFIIGFGSSISTVALIGLLIFLCRSWIVSRLKASIKHEYDLKIFEIERQKEIRLKGEIVGELLAEWIRPSATIDYHQLNRLSFQAYLWLPEKLAKDLSNSLAKEKGAKDVRALLKEIRTYLLGCKDRLSANHVIVFEEPDPNGAYSNPFYVQGNAPLK